MPSSISSSERLTAADRPGVAQPVPERPVPVKPWGGILVTVAILVTLATVAWEWRMRMLQLLPGDIRDSASFWAEQRRRVDTENIPVAIVGDSRILFDTDLDRFEALTGVRPLQLALAGTNGRPFMEELAADSDFKGLLIVGIAETSFFRKDAGLYGNALERYHFESPANRVSFQLYKKLSDVLGFLDREYRLSILLLRLDRGMRPKANSPYIEPWKLSTTGAERQTFLWSRIETDAYLNAHARAFWARLNKAPPVPADVVTMTQEKTRDAVEKIRARGGDVIFIRPPSRGVYRVNEDRMLPRARGWDPLLLAAGVSGLHFEDDPAMRSLSVPELSHLSRACATVFTDAYVRWLADTTSRIKLRTDAPAALRSSDCAPTPEAIAVQKAVESE